MMKMNKTPSANTQGRAPEENLRSRGPIAADPAAVRAAWRARFQQEVAPPSRLWPLLLGLLGGLVTALAIGAVALFVPSVRDAVAGMLAPQPTETPAEPKLPAPGAPLLTFEAPSPLIVVPGMPLGSPVSVLVTVGGKPKASVLVTFKIEPGEGNPAVTVSPQQGITDQAGQVSVKVAPGDKIGKAILIAEAEQKKVSLPIEVKTLSPTQTPTLPPPPLIVASLTFDPASIDLGQVSGPISITVTARDNSNAPVAGQAVTVVVSNDNGTVTPAQVVTGPDGRAQFTYTPSVAPRSGTITAVSGEASGVLVLNLPVTPTAKITFDPPTLDLGVNQKATVRVLVTTGDAGAPVTNAAVTLRVEPAGLATVAGGETSQGMTDASNGELTAELAFGPATGSGKLVATLSDGTQAEVPITVRPVAIPAGAGKNIREKPNTDAKIIGYTKAGEQYAIVGKSDSAGTWWLVRLPQGGLAWIGQAALASVEGDTSAVPIVDPNATAPQASPQLSPTPVPTIAPTAIPMPAPTETAAPVVSTPTPKAPQEGDYSPAGTYTVTAMTGQQAALFRVDDATIQLAELPAGGTVEVEAKPSGQEIPAGFVLVRAQFWVSKERIQGVLLVQYDQTSLACWEVQDAGGGQSGPKSETCGTLLPIKTTYNAGADIPPSRGDWRLVTARGWMLRGNIGAKQP